MNIAVAQSGGPTCAINASLVGVFREALKTPYIDAVFGSVNGIEGIIKDELVNLKSIITTNEEMELLRQTPSTVLGSCRVKLDENDTETFDKIINCFEKHRISAFFYIGGNDSMDTVQKLSSYVKKQGKDIKIIGIPKTIDNDLPVTDHTPGFGSAAKYVAATVQEIIRDCSVYSIESVTIIEIMGRNAGWLTASTCVLKANDEEAPHLIYLPESDFSIDRFLEDVRAEQAKHMAVVVAVSEGVTIPKEQLDASYQSNVTDNFGHKYLSGIGKALETIVRESIGCKVRSIELNVMQRCSSHICSKTDIDEAELIGAQAVKAALSGETGKTMVFRRISDIPYVVDIDCVDTELVANKEKFLPKSWITERGNNVSAEAIKYLLPLIQGEVKIKMKNGMPVHYKLSVRK
ncbi:MAG: 6-phosphofructokinase [Ruminococcus sp.]|nr:6-phosphofructokinase [Ruminococcus sp.]